MADTLAWGRRVERWAGRQVVGVGRAMGREAGREMWREGRQGGTRDEWWADRGVPSGGQGGR